GVSMRACGLLPLMGVVLSAAIASAQDRALVLPALPLAATGGEPAPAPRPAELSVDVLIREVLERNPSLAQMEAAWQAASARVPQVMSLDDPMFGTALAPAAWGSREVNGGYRIELSQKFPFPGKLRLRGENARLEAGAAGSDVDDMRLALIELTKQAYVDYYLAHRARTVNEENLKLLLGLRKKAQTRAVNLLKHCQEVRQTEIELGRQRERLLELEQNRKVALARLNTLMSRPPEETLPPPPERLEVGLALAPVERLRESALARRPDLQALAQRLA